MSSWQPRLIVAVVVAVLLLSVLVSTRSRQTPVAEPPLRDRSPAQAVADAHAAGKPAWKDAHPIIEGGARSSVDERERPELGDSDVVQGEPGAPLSRPTLAAPRGLPHRAGAGEGESGDTGSRDDKARAVEAKPGGALAEMATASGISPSFAAFRQASGGDPKGSTPIEEQNVDFDAAVGAYFPPNAVLGYPGRGGLQVEAGTVMFWVQPVDWDWKDNLTYSFFLLRDTRSLDHHFAIGKDGPWLRFQIVNEDDVESDVLWPLNSDWERGAWHHVAATWGDSLMDLYVDGSLVGERAVDGIPAVQPDSPAYWGSSRGTAGAGAILADGRIFDRVVPESDIAAEAQRVPQ